MQNMPGTVSLRGFCLASVCQEAARDYACVDLSVLVAYLIGMALVGVYFAKRNVTTDAYFLGGRSFKGWVIGLSLVGTSISPVSFVGFPADAFKTAWLRLLTNLMLPLGLIAASYFFLPFYRKNGISSAYQYLELRFGPGVCVYGAAAFVAVSLCGSAAFCTW